MKKLIFSLSVFCFLNFNTLSFGQEVVWEEIGRGNSKAKCVLAEKNAKIICFGSEKGVFKSDDGALSWRNVLSLKGDNKKINYLSFDPQDKNSIYAATGNGLFRSRTLGKNWDRIFKGGNYLENECSALLVLQFGIYLGTRAGLFISTDHGRSWHKEAGKIGKSSVLAFASDPKEPDCIYVACTDAVFRSLNRGLSWEEVFIATSAISASEAEELSEDVSEEEASSGIKYIVFLKGNASNLYLATSRGVYKSPDKGITWEPLSNYGLLSRDIKFLLATDNSDIYAATKSGVFEYRNGRWFELSLGLIAQGIEFIAADNQGSLYVAAENGLFRGKADSHVNYKNDNTIEIYCKDEPGINEVQQAAIKYAEVEPEKISNWRKQAAKKALLPTVSAGVSRDTGDLWHWETGSTVKNGDDVLIRGKDTLDWDVRLTWDLSEIIWNNDQTSIDTRSRLMVQLRDDVLDEVTKLYFERIRVKTEIDNLAIEDRRKTAEKQLRLMELTASLDALTGGYFSKQIQSK